MTSVRNSAFADLSRRPGTPELLDLPGVQLDLGTAHLEQADAVVTAPADELAQIELLRLPGSARVAGQEAGSGDHLPDQS